MAEYTIVVDSMDVSLLGVEVAPASLKAARKRLQGLTGTNEDPIHEAVNDFIQALGRVGVAVHSYSIGADKAHGMGRR